MKKNYLKNIMREVRASLPRFLAIFCITALGVGFLAGLLSTTPDMLASADAYYDSTRLMDIRLLSTMGFCQEDVGAVADTEGVQRAEGLKSADLLVSLENGDTVVARIHGVDMDAQSDGSAINQLELTCGRFPSAAGECLMLEEKVPVEGAGQDSTLTFAPDNQDLEDTLRGTGLTITGVAKCSYYMSFEREQASIGNGRVALILFVPQEQFAFDYFTEICALAEGAQELEAYSDEYDGLIDGVCDSLEELAVDQVLVRRSQIVEEAQAELDKAKAEYESEKARAEAELGDAWQEILNGRAEVAAGERDLNLARQQLSQGRAELETQRTEGAQQLSQAQAEIDEGRGQYEAGKAQYDAAKAELDAAGQQLEQNREQMEQLRLLITSGLPVSEEMKQALAQYDEAVAQYEQGAQTLEETYQTLESSRIALEQGQQELDEGRAQYESGIAQGERELENAAREIEKGERELENARQTLSQGEADYEAGKAEAEEKLLDGEYEIRDAQAEIDKIEKPQWYVMTREQNLSCVSFKQNADKVAAIATVFPLFFFLVALLVTLTSMTRMVEEQRVQIGTLKALGYGPAAICFKYLLYAGAAGLLGSAAGLAIGLRLFPSVIWKTYGIMYTLPPLVLRFNPQYALVSASALILCALVATLGACVSSLREQPALLMRPKAPKAGKRIFLEHIGFLWKRMPFTHKVTARNLIRYKKRFFMTVVGVAGCTALLVTGFGLRDSINAIIGKQFEELWNYDTTVGLRHDSDDQTDFRVRAILESEPFESTLAVHMEAGYAQTGAYRSETTLFVPRETQALSDFVTLRDRRTHETVPFEGESAVVITEKLSQKLGAGAGDTIEIEDADGRRASVTVTGVTENYVQGYVYMTAQVYAEAFGAQPEYTSVLAVTSADTDEARDELAERLLGEKNISGVQFNKELEESFSDMLKSINTIVVVLILSAAALAFVVLYNLTGINIAEREKELATIKVLGFFRGEVARYIFRETNLLALFGTLCGLALGIALHAFVVRTAEVDMVMFGRDIEPLSFVLSGVLTMAFALAVNLVMRRPLRRISMVESLKAPE